MTSLKKWLENPENARLYAQEDLIMETTEQILKWMEEQETSRSDLAEKIGKSRSYVTQLLSGERNMTLRTLADICWALGVEVSFGQKSQVQVEQVFSECKEEKDNIYVVEFVHDSPRRNKTVVSTPEQDSYNESCFSGDWAA